MLFYKYRLFYHNNFLGLNIFGGGGSKYHKYQVPCNVNMITLCAKCSFYGKIECK